MSHMKKSIYFDHAATTPMHPEVVNCCLEAMNDTFGNPNSLHAVGRHAYGALERARHALAAELHARPSEVIFTSGGTESDNTAILQIAQAKKSQGKHIITTNIEHSAVIEPMQELMRQGFEVTYLSADKYGNITLEEVEKAIRPDTVLVSIMWTNNELGTILPVQEIGRYLKDIHPNVIFHTDAVQAFGLQEIDVKKAGIDLLSASAHKLNGPKGVGLLYVREGLVFSSFMKGGSQERKHRAGTVNVPGILGFQKATEIMHEKRDTRKQFYQELREAVLSGLNNHGVDYELNGSQRSYSPHIMSLWIKGVPSERLLTLMDLNGFSIAAGSACSAGNPEPSHVLSAVFGSDHPAVNETIRISFGYGNKLEDVEVFVQSLSKAALRYQKKDD